MMHTYTAKKNHKLYRYYVCLHAQEAGWQACPTKSLPANAIESAVVERIRGIGANAEVQNEVWRSVQEKKESKTIEIDKECHVLEMELGRVNGDIHKIAAGDARGSRSSTERLAQLQDRACKIEKRHGELLAERTALHKGQVQHTEVSRALSLFEPVWDSLPVRDQARVVRLLVEQVGFDGRNNEVSITFTPLGMRLLNQETAGDAA